jgi:hypothetical protein
MKMIDNVKFYVVPNFKMKEIITFDNDIFLVCSSTGKILTD